MHNSVNAAPDFVSGKKYYEINMKHFGSTYSHVWLQPDTDLYLKLIIDGLFEEEALALLAAEYPSRRDWGLSPKVGKLIIHLIVWNILHVLMCLR